jgi:segregation and condensation protein A
VVTDRVSITERIDELVGRLEREGSFAFESCFAFLGEAARPTTVKGEVVVTLLAILEMTRLKMVRLTQVESDGQIYITKAEGDLRERIEALRARPEEYK